MRILHIGDIVGKPGRDIVRMALHGLRRREGLSLIVANAENACGGSGLNPAAYRELIDCGVDCITMGDHIYRRKELFQTLQSQNNIVKPANYPKSAPGKEFAIVEASGGIRVAVISIMGRVFMRPVDCPWEAIDRVLATIPASIKIRCVDFHAEATSDKQVMGRYLDGRVSYVLGTHTHVPTADEQIFKGGTAFQCDIGMTGPHESIIGRNIERVTETTVTFRPTQFDVARDDVRLSGSIVDVDPETGRAVSIRRIQIREEEAKALQAEYSKDASG
ncbi:YmdB family metallophosphoesterase [Blastopirellula sp. JC732]|uniref:YmdB family metallophosphoesterase n=1 Tax=Blastopirellula sediminis TaxID=2894196 RepID=A0A9X1SJG1_9BACT|nr:TIGR00282 family metallophosphoesterase [Blastopirellula sediminis]MCC9604800.1 YmdB family metallophosphoesterase [Blastopirellula sediminis]MCC9631901.1 YmdB family metallophosphoesterase [Blastopirellula sediminis]